MSHLEMPKPDEAILSRRARIVAELVEAAGAQNVISDNAETIAYECDALSAYRCPPLAVVLPRTTEQVSAVLKTCLRLGVPVVPRGSGTSLSGGALPTADCVVVGVSRLNRILDVDFDNRFIRVQSGMTNLSVSDAVAEQQFFYAPDPSSQLACAIAGNVAMNSGGAHCLKYGVTTNNLMGVTLVLMNGEIVEIGGPHLDPAGLDLLGIVCGSEGQFGIVTVALSQSFLSANGVASKQHTCSEFRRPSCMVDSILLITRKFEVDDLHFYRAAASEFVDDRFEGHSALAVFFQFLG